MKVCTDSCIFGAWGAANFKHARRVLDIGTGTGLLSLMYAQQNPESIIDAVEPDQPSAQHAMENFRLSPWSRRLFICQTPVQQHIADEKYDLILTNPPFFENDLLSAEESRNNAMHNTSLTLKALTENITSHLSPAGKLAVLLPYHRTEYFIHLIKDVGLNLDSQLLLKQTPGHPFFRSILSFTYVPVTEINHQELIIKIDGSYSKEFINLLKDYYLYL